MKSNLIFFSLMLAASLAAAEKSATKTKAVKAPAPPAVMTIPPDAVPAANGTWLYIDKQGRHWSYSKTPFGISRIEEAAVAPPPPTGEELPTVTETADGYRFKLKTPFGSSTWDKKRGDLNERERHAVEASKATSKPQ